MHRKIFFIRHGEYYRHADTKELNQIGSLTPKGREQASKTALYLKKAGIKPTVVFYSDILRARQTAAAITSVFPDSLKIIILSLLREISYNVKNDDLKFPVSSYLTYTCMTV